MKKVLATLILVSSILPVKFSHAQIKPGLSIEGETLNFELVGQKNWDYDLKRVKEGSKTKVQLLLKTEDKKAIEDLRTIENPFVEKVNVLPSAVDNKTVIEFVLKDSRIETFDYLTDQPSKLIIDFYESESAIAEIDEKLPTKEVKKSNVVKKVASAIEKPVVEKVERKPADVDFLRLVKEDGIEASLLARSGLYDGGDSQYKRFTMNESDYKEEAVIKSRSNYYLKFPVLETEFSFWKKMKESPPEYEIQPEDSSENKQARLLVSLFKKKRSLVFLQTYDWFRNKYPKSNYLEMLSYMKGDAFMGLWGELKDKKFLDESLDSYKMALEKYPDSVLAERTSLLTGLLANDGGDYMTAIRRFKNHIDNKKYQKKISQSYAKLAMSHSYSKLKRLDEALNLLNEIQQETKDVGVLTEIAVRKGDYNFFNGRYNEAIEAYDAAAKSYAAVSKSYPSAYFNKMEATFWKEKYKDCHKAALDFAQYFPSHSFAPYALTRVGELLDIMGAEQTKSVGAFLETHFRYGDSPKTIVAKLHLLSSRMNQMKSEEIDQTLKKMDELAAKSELENIDQFKVAVLSDGFATRKEYTRAIEILSTFYQQNPTRPDVKQVTQRIVKNISDELKLQSDQKQYRSMLKTYKQYADTWLKTDRRIDTDYFLGLAYENAGAFAVAHEKFVKVKQELEKIKGTQAEKVAYVNQYLPSVDSLNLRLAVNSFENSNPQEAYSLLEMIQKPLQLSEVEQIERVQLASKLYDAKGDHSTSIRYLSELAQLWKGDEKLSLPILFRLADKHIANNEIAKAQETFNKALGVLLKDANSTEENIAKLAQAYSKLLINQKKDNDAISMLNSLVEKFDKVPLASERYLLGDLLFKQGEFKKAELVWAKIPDSSDNIWKKLSQEKLKQASWDNSYKKHIKRIPAMSKLEEAK